MDGLRTVFRGGEGAADLMADLFAVDGVYETMFALPGMPTRFQGRDVIRTHLRTRLGGAAAVLDTREAHLTTYPGADPELLVISVELVGFSHGTDSDFRVNSSLGVLRIRDDEIVTYHDYPNAIGGSAAAGSLDKLGNLLIHCAGQQPGS
ncbi:nuclear transport factor 2 family protein [Micromonospora wenchangensis]|uniref:nuclear transport factor 2 family protein n=1 Tax=Micromonospora wenchangensis TaxID=1185415 RepID=UPI0037FD27FA